ncbi:hypothetical protein ACHAWT_001176 [Skeletonema menzelii]
MVENTATTPFFSHNHGFNDEETVQVSDANSLLGSYLLEGDFEDALAYLDTPEGERDATAKNDPLGLFNEDNNKSTLPKTKNGALFASLYVRAPFPLIKKICDISKETEISDLMYVLSVIPHEEQLRLGEMQQRKIPYRSRSWTNDEYGLILNLFLRECLHHLEAGTSAPSLLEKCPSWIIPSAFVVTPLAMAAYNPDVPSNILQIICMLEPKAIVKRNRWEKVKLLMNKEWFEQYKAQSSSLNAIIVATLPSPSAITLEQVKVACDEAMKRQEWELVRELLKQFNSKIGEQLAATSLSPIETALAQHDRKVRPKLRKQEQKRSRDEWLHRNMGLVMYPVDTLMDLIYSVIPQTHDESLVSPMS